MNACPQLPRNLVSMPLIVSGVRNWIFSPTARPLIGFLEIPWHLILALIGGLRTIKLILGSESEGSKQKKSHLDSGIHNSFLLFYTPQPRAKYEIWLFQIGRIGLPSNEGNIKYISMVLSCQFHFSKLKLQIHYRFTNLCWKFTKWKVSKVKNCPFAKIILPVHVALSEKRNWLLWWGKK